MQIASDLVSHADYLIRNCLADTDIDLAPVSLTVEAEATNPSIPAIKLAMDYFGKMLDTYAQGHTAAVGRRVRHLVAG